MAKKVIDLSKVDADKAWKEYLRQDKEINKVLSGQVSSRSNNSASLVYRVMDMFSNIVLFGSAVAFLVFVSWLLKQWLS